MPYRVQEFILSLDSSVYSKKNSQDNSQMKMIFIFTKLRSTRILNPEKLLRIYVIPHQHWHNVYIGSALFIKDWKNVMHLTELHILYNIPHCENIII